MKILPKIAMLKADQIIIGIIMIILGFIISAKVSLISLMESTSSSSSSSSSEGIAFSADVLPGSSVLLYTALPAFFFLPPALGYLTKSMVHEPQTAMIAKMIKRVD